MSPKKPSTLVTSQFHADVWPMVVGQVCDEGVPVGVISGKNSWSALLVNLGRVGFMCRLALLVDFGASTFVIADKSATVVSCVVGSSTMRCLNVVKGGTTFSDHSGDFRILAMIEFGRKAFAEQGKVRLVMVQVA